MARYTGVEHNGILCTGEAYRKAVKLTFAHGAALADPKGLFNASLEGNTRRAIDIHEGVMPGCRGVRYAAEAAAAFNAAKKLAVEPAAGRLLRDAAGEGEAAGQRPALPCHWLAREVAGQRPALPCDWPVHEVAGQRPALPWRRGIRVGHRRWRAGRNLRRRGQRFGVTACPASLPCASRPSGNTPATAASRPAS